MFYPVAHFTFVTWDDASYVQVTQVANGFTWPGVVWAFTTATEPYWHPLTWISHMVDVQLFGTWAGGHHLTSVVIHALNVCLIFWLFGRTTARWGASAFVAALFAVHPLHVESVAWVAERKDVLSTCFFLITLAAYVRYVSRPSAGNYALMCAFYACGLMAKPMLVTLPVVLILMDIWPLGRRPTIADKIPLFAMAAAAALATILIQYSAGAMGGSTTDAFPIGLRIANALLSVVVYLRQTVWPVDLSAFYPYPRAFPSGFAIAGALIVLTGISVLAIRTRQTRPYLLVGWLWYLVTLLPVVGFIQVGDQAHADRFTYIPHIGLFAAMTWAAADWLRVARIAPRISMTVSALVILGFAEVARSQVFVWADSLVLWTHALAVTTDNDRAHNGLGAMLGNAGRFAEAIPEFTEAVRINPTLADAQHNLGIALAATNRAVEALPHYAEAVRLQPRVKEAHTHYGSALAALGRFDDAVTEFKAAIALDPNQIEPHINLGMVLATEGRFADAEREERAAIALNSASARAHYALGFALAGAGPYQGRGE